MSALCPMATLLNVALLHSCYQSLTQSSLGTVLRLQVSTFEMEHEPMEDAPTGPSLAPQVESEPHSSDDEEDYEPSLSSTVSSDQSDSDMAELLESEDEDDDTIIYVNTATMPDWLSVVKQHAAGTGLFQPNDVSKAHSTINTFVHYDSYVLLEGRHSECDTPLIALISTS
jgi:hypothetical protein